MKNLNAFLVFFVTLLLTFSFVPVNVAGVTECSNGKQVGESWPACDGTTSRLKTCNADGTYSWGQVLESNSRSCGYQPPRRTECGNGRPIGSLWGECSGTTEVEKRCNEDGSYSTTRVVRENSPSCGYVPPKITKCGDHFVGDLWGDCGGYGVGAAYPKTTELEKRCNEDGSYSVTRVVRQNSPSCGYVAPPVPPPVPPPVTPPKVQKVCNPGEIKYEQCFSDSSPAGHRQLQCRQDGSGFNPITSCPPAACGSRKVGDTWGGSCVGTTLVQRHCTWVSNDVGAREQELRTSNDPNCKGAPTPKTCGNNKPDGAKWGVCGGGGQGVGVVKNQPKTSEFEITCNAGKTPEYTYRLVRENSPSCGFVPPKPPEPPKPTAAADKCWDNVVCWNADGTTGHTRWGTSGKTSDCYVNASVNRGVCEFGVARWSCGTCRAPEEPTAVTAAPVISPVAPAPVTPPTPPAPANNAPVLSSIGDKIVRIKTLLQFVILGTDPDNNALTFSASNLPSGATFDSASRTFRWIPNVVGIFRNIQFAVSDSQATDTESININVVPAAPGNVQLARIDLFDSCVEPGNELMFSVNMENNAGERLDAVSLTAFVPELGVRTKIGPEEMGDGKETTRQLSVEVPDNAPTGEYYLRLGVNEDDGDIRRVKHRAFSVKEACN